MAAMIADSDCIIPLSGQAERRLGAPDVVGMDLLARAQIGRFGARA